MLKPQDLLIVLKLCVWPEDRGITYDLLAAELGMTKSEVHAGVRRAVASRLLRMADGRPVPLLDAVREFVESGAPYAFPAMRGEVEFGDWLTVGSYHIPLVVHVDELGKFAYSIGQDRRLRKASWSAAGDEAIIFGPRKSSSPDGSSWAAGGVFIRSTTGALLMEQSDLAGGTNTVLLRSTAASDGACPGGWRAGWR